MKRLFKHIRRWLNISKENARLEYLWTTVRADSLRVCADRDAALEKLKAAQWSEDGARAQLMQLRVFGMTSGAASRTGYGVTAFIPSETLEFIRAEQAAGRWSALRDFTKLVSDELVSRALRGALHINSRGAASAMVFPAIVPGKPLGVVGNIEDCFKSEAFEHAKIRELQRLQELLPPPTK